MGKYIKKFDTHSDYEDFIETEDYIRPNVSHCVLENEVHYNRYFITPKLLVEYTHSFLMSTYEKFFMHRQEITDPEVKLDYSPLSEQRMSKACYQLDLKTMLKYRNLLIDGSNTVLLEYNTNDTEIFNLDISNALQIAMRFDYNNMYIEVNPSLYKTNEIYNGNDVFYISSWYVIDGNDDGTVEELAYNTINYGDNIVLLCPHNTFANFTIAYPDGNGGYTTTKPTTFELTPSIVDGTFHPYPEWITLTLFNYQDQEINTRVDNVITALRNDFRIWFNGDFSALSVLDDIKLEVSKDVYEVIKNPWTYFNENIIFSGYAYVDLGLPSGTLWAMTNIGTINFSDLELYFAWGETQGYTAEQVGTDKQFSWEDYKFNPSSDGSTMTKYNETDGKTILDPEDDAARVNWGSSWKMPTQEQCEELLNTEYVTNEWVTDYYGVNGRLFTSVKNGNNLFFPAAGNADDGSMDRVGNYGGIWSNSLNYYSVEYSHFLYFTNNNVSVDNNGRRLGCSVRAVINQ